MSRPGVAGPDAWQAVSGLSRQNSVYRHMLEVCDQIADATLTGADARELSRMLARLLKKTVVLLDPAFGLRACSGDDTRLALSPLWQPDDPGICRLLRALATERRPLRMPAVPDSVLTRGCLAIPVGIGATNLGYLLILDRPDGGSAAADATDDVDLLTAGYVATLFALTLANERTSTDLGLRYEGALVEALVAGHFEDRRDAERKTAALGIADRETFRVAVVRGLAPVIEDVADQIEAIRSKILMTMPGTALAVRQTELIAILHDTGDGAPARLKDTLTPFLNGSRAVRAGMACGVSGPDRYADEIPRLYREAGHAVDIGARIALDGPVVEYGELGIYRLLLQIGDVAQLRRFAEETLGPLIRYDAAHKVGLVRTLSVFLDQRESLKRAASRLHVHANTVAYRLQRIEQLTPLDLTDADDRLVAHVAVKILEVQQQDAAGS